MACKMVERYFGMANFRADRAREILAALINPDFKEFNRKYPPKLAAALGRGRIFGGAQ